MANSNESEILLLIQAINVLVNGSQQVPFQGFKNSIDATVLPKHNVTLACTDTITSGKITH